MRSSALPAPLSWPIDLLDRARLLWLRALGPLAVSLVRSRELRVAVGGTLAIVVALVITGIAPMWMLALGPIVLGVPHAASDLRYLVMRPALHRRPAFWALIAAPLAILMWTIDVRWGLAAALGGALAARAPVSRRALVLIPAGLALALAWLEPFTAALAIAYLHNFVAVGMWLAWRKRSGWLHLLPLAALVLGCAAILSGALDPLVRATGGLEAEPGGQGLWYHLAVLSPGFVDPWGPRLVMLFAFTQAVHYSIWTRLVPEEDRARETPRTFHASLRAWVDDSGWLVVVASVGLAAAIAIWALVDLVGAREGYLRGVLFHGYLELAVIALLVGERRGLRAAASA